MCWRIGASGAERLCALSAVGRARPVPQSHGSVAVRMATREFQLRRTAGVIISRNLYRCAMDRRSAKARGFESQHA